MFALRHYLLLSSKEHVLMFLIWDIYITLVAIAMKKIKIVVLSWVVFSVGKKKIALISLNNGMNKIQCNNVS